MKVEKLIEELKKLPKRTEIIIDSSSDFDDCTEEFTLNSGDFRNGFGRSFKLNPAGKSIILS
tara:strand:- start:2967 stop:3152 length:186 start_codon:yes stop_codon:yes gene_type:complete